jgi:hypothetical protein
MQAKSVHLCLCLFMQVPGISGQAGLTNELVWAYTVQIISYNVQLFAGLVPAGSPSGNRYYWVIYGAIK